MALIRSLPENASISDVYESHADLMQRLPPFEQALMRGPSPFTEAERELIGAYVSGLNACSYCYRSHSLTAMELGVSEDLFSMLMDDLEAAPVDERMKPVLRYARKLTETPSRMTEVDAAAVYDAGWDDTALFYTVVVCAYFNFANRLVDGAGVMSDDLTLKEGAKYLASVGYAGGDET